MRWLSVALFSLGVNLVMAPLNLSFWEKGVFVAGMALIGAAVLVSTLAGMAETTK